MEDFILARDRSKPRRSSGSELMSKGAVGGFLNRWIAFWSILQWVSSWDADWIPWMNLIAVSKSSRQVFLKTLSRFGNVASEGSSSWAPALLLGSKSRHPGSGSAALLSDSSKVLSKGGRSCCAAGSGKSVLVAKLPELVGKGGLGWSRGADEASEWDLDNWGVASANGATSIGKELEDWTKHIQVWVMSLELQFEN